MYRALYRKWRPAVFGDVVGQQNITAALQNQIENNRVGHAYIFTGTRGTGKTSCAKIFAKAVNCPHTVHGEPCCQCDVCRGLDNGSILDVVEIDAASNNGVDSIRDLRDETAYTPSVCTYKVYIIDEVHMLSTSAFNALLKIMEEPPAHVIFILATTEIHKVPATILSRCQRYDFLRIMPQDIKARLEYICEQENITVTPEAAELIARLVDGAMRDALSILDTCAGVSAQVDEALVRRMVGVTDKDYLFQISAAIERRDAANALELVSDLRRKSVDLRRLCEELIAHYRNIMLASITSSVTLLDGVTAEDEEKYKACGIPHGKAITAIETLGRALEKMTKGTDQRIDLELALVELCAGSQSTARAAQPTVQPQVQPQMQQSAQPAEQTQPIFAPPLKTEPAPVPTMQPMQPVQEPAPQPAAEFVREAPAPQPAANAEGQELFAGWEQVKQKLQTSNMGLYMALENSLAYFDGKRVLIDGNDLFLDLIRTSDISKASLKQAIFEVTGHKYPIGPYEKKAAQARVHTAADELERLKEQGVEIEIKE